MSVKEKALNVIIHAIESLQSGSAALDIEAAKVLDAIEDIQEFKDREIIEQAMLAVISMDSPTMGVSDKELLYWRSELEKIAEQH